MKESIFVPSEQVLDTSGKASIQHAATKVTNIDSFIFRWRLLYLQQSEFNAPVLLLRKFRHRFQVWQVKS